MASIAVLVLSAAAATAAPPPAAPFVPDITFDADAESPMPQGLMDAPLPGTRRPPAPPPRDRLRSWDWGEACGVAPGAPKPPCAEVKVGDAITLDGDSFFARTDGKADGRMVAGQRRSPDGRAVQVIYDICGAPEGPEDLQRRPLRSRPIDEDRGGENTPRPGRRQEEVRRP